jgi:hypothetical protein
MEYSPQDSLETRKIQYMTLLDGYPEAKGIQHSVLMDDCRVNPDAGKRMNDYVLAKAADQNIPADALTGILAASPLVQQMVEDKLPASVVLNELIDLTRNQYAQQLENANESFPTVQNALSSAFTILKTTEQALFSVTPLPLQGTKNIIQSIAAPLAVTALATKIPGVDQVISTTIGLASSFTSTAFSAIAGNAVAYFGHAAMDSMPSAVQQALTASLPNNAQFFGALAGQSVASVSQAVSHAVVSGAADKLGQVLGGMGAAVMIGNSAIEIGRKLSYEVSEKGVIAIVAEAKQTMASMFEQSKQVLAKAEMFIESVKEKITGVKMSQQNNNDKYPQIPADFGIPEATGIDVNKLIEQGNTTLARSYVRVDTIRQSLNDLYNLYKPGSEPGSKPGFDYIGTASHVAFLREQFEAVKANFERIIKEQIKDGKYTPTAQQKENLTVKPAVIDNETTEAATPMKPAVIDNEVTEAATPMKSAVINNEVTEEKPTVKPIIIDNETTEAATPVKSVQDKAAEAYALSTLNSVFGSRGIEIKNSQIDYNGETVFKLKNHGLDKSEMNSEAMDAIQKALNDPSNLKGEVRISLGGQTLVHVKDGEILTGHAFIKESIKVEVSTNEKQRYDQLASDVRATGYEKTKQITAAAFSSGDTIADVKDILSKHDAPYQEFEKSNPALNEQMMVQAQARAAKEPSEGKTQERTVERAQDMAIVA